jgi:hypothetical protein
VADSVRDAFVALEEAVLSEARLAGLEAAYATVRRRRQTRLAVVAALVVLVALVPVVAFAALRSNGPAPVATTPPTPGPAPTPTAEPTGTPTPDPMPPDPMAPLPAGVIPGVLRITSDRYAPTPLNEQRLEVPPFRESGCPSGQLQFHGRGTSDLNDIPNVQISETASGDVTGDGEVDHVAILTCRVRLTGGDQIVEQVVVYSGQLALVGQVVSLGVNTDATTPRILPDRTIRVNVGDREPANAPSEWRSYR